MKRFILNFILFAAIYAFAQDDERTPEGYRIIRIKKEYTKDYKDSMAYVEEMKKEPVRFRYSWGVMLSVGYKAILGSADYDYSYYANNAGDSTTFFQGAPIQLGVSAWIPLNEYNFALRTGLLFESAYLFCKKDLFFDDPENPGNWKKERGRILQGRIVFPLLFAVKTRTSPIMFEVGTQISIPIVDKYESVDLIDKDLRASVDVAILLGAHAFVNRYIAFDLLWEIQPKKVYNDDFLKGVSDLIAAGIKLGVVFTPF
jgi:hypothetical protein